MERIRHGHSVYEDRRGIVLRDDGGEECVVDRSRPIEIRYVSDEEFASVPVAGGLSTPETFSGALLLAARFGLRITTEDGLFTARALDRDDDARAGAEAVWKILEAHCGAANMKDDFMYHVGEALRTGDKLEYRFQGALGFGGKLRYDRHDGLRVDCYREDRTPERERMIEAANRALVNLKRE